MVERKLFYAGVALVILLSLFVGHSLDPGDSSHTVLITNNVDSYILPELYIPGTVEFDSIEGASSITLNGVTKTNWEMDVNVDACDTHILEANNDQSHYNCTPEKPCMPGSAPLDVFVEKELIVDVADTACADGVCSFFFLCDQHQVHEETGWSDPYSPTVRTNASMGYLFLHQKDWFINDAPEKRVWMFESKGFDGWGVGNRVHFISSGELLTGLYFNVSWYDSAQHSYADDFCKLEISSDGKFVMTTLAPPIVYVFDEVNNSVGDNHTMVSKLTLCD
ncbi:MAG: hypothetical protein H6502_03300 [Candidatus Woesearchaeota archaeon]|nr:MAG: hypothetical protein H6502_03300 [Candidatus Woesearchaeota archaeon]